MEGETMAEIKLSQSQVTLIDDEDYEWLSKFKWHYSQGGNTGYAKRDIWVKGKGKVLKMHRIILGLNFGDKRQADHINGNGLDNRKGNLRIATKTQNSCNRDKQINNTSGYKGAFWVKAKKKWKAQIRSNGKSYHLGYFNDVIKAAKAYNKGAIKHHGEFAYQNIIKED
jgi:hypothetical protein